MLPSHGLATELTFQVNPKKDVDDKYQGMSNGII
jgi:hypothetical protein